MFAIRITDIAEQDIQQSYQWWRDNRSPSEAERWYDSIYPAIKTLESMPHRCALAREHEAFADELRQLLFGIGRKATHRILFTIEDQTVMILRVLHHAQQDVTADERLSH